MRITDVIGIMVSVYADWEGVLANPNYARINNVIAWGGFDPMVVRGPVTMHDVAELAASRQYTFQVADDGALIQVVYAFDGAGDNVVSARLAYYGVAPAQAEAGSGIQEDGSDDSAALISGSEYPVVPWLRIDYDPAQAGGVLHGDCHLHVSGLPAARFLVCGVPAPKQFVEFVLAVCYPETYRVMRLRDDGNYIDAERIRQINHPSITCGPAGVFELMTHLKVPSPN